jgi:hypothetical protein
MMQEMLIVWQPAHHRPGAGEFSAAFLEHGNFESFTKLSNTLFIGRNLEPAFRRNASRELSKISVTL